MTKPELRPAKRLAHCRVCDEDIKIGNLMVTWYSSWNRGQHIHIHPECVAELYRISNETIQDCIE